MYEGGVGRGTGGIKCGEDGGREYWEDNWKLGVSLEGARSLVHWKLPGIYEGDPS